MMRILIMGLFLLLSTASGIPYQKPPDKIDVLNNYVHFLNESIHGMLIVHRLLENFNLDINKYVDLDSYQINFYSNRDLPRDIFEDPENWFYDTSPYEWYDKIIAESDILDSDISKKLNTDASFIVDLIKTTNQKRFDIEALISGQDLTDSDQLQKVYDELESCVKLYNSFFETQLRMEKQLYSIDFPKPAYYKNLAGLYQDLRGVLLAVRNKNDNQFNLINDRFKTTLSSFSLATIPPEFSGNNKVRFHTNNLLAQASKAKASAQRFADGVPPNKDYELYGEHYFYYNSDIINKFNRYGSGIVFEMNELLKLLNFQGLYFTELPHYYKVIYPRKIEKINVIASEQKTIAVIPPEIDGRKLNKKEEGILKVDNEIIEVSIYDHMIQDGDIVSLNFNGEWVLRRHKLTSEPFKLKLKLNQEGKNFLALHAENMGARPPNTMALSYFAMGKKQLYIMNSDMNTSEVIEIVVQ